MERLQSTLNRVYRNVAFYRHSFDAHRVNIERIKSIEALRELPFTTREDLGKSYPYDMFAVPLREIVRIHATSGTAGTPIVIGYTRNDLRNWTEYTARLLAAAGITANDVVQIAFPYNLSAGAFGFHQGAEQIGASVIPSPATASSEKQVTIMKDFKTTALICTPSYALRLAADARGTARASRAPPVADRHLRRRAVERRVRARNSRRACRSSRMTRTAFPTSWGPASPANATCARGFMSTRTTSSSR